VNPLKTTCLTIIQSVKGAWSFLRALAGAVNQSGGDIPAMRREAERLDRIRNPSKYLGK